MLGIYWPQECRYIIDHKKYVGALSTKKIYEH